VHERIKSYADHGGAILVVHQAINAFLDSPHWNGIVGGRWVRGETWHPPIAARPHSTYADMRTR